MENPVSLQAGLFFSSLLFGVAMGVVYVLFGLLRKRGRFWRNAAADILFWCLCGPLCFWFFMGLNGGDVRGYLIAAMLLGGSFVAVGSYYLSSGRKSRKKKKKEGE